MGLTSLALGLLPLLRLVATAPAANDIKPCGDPVPSADFLEFAQEQAARESAAKEKRQFARIVTPVYVYVVASSDSFDDGYVSDQQVNDQITRINDDFRVHRIQFILQKIERFINPTWATGKNDEAMKRATRRGDYEVLNFWVQKSIGDGIAGLATLPTNLTTDPQALFVDGIQVAAEHLPGGTGYPFAEGGVGTHEVGHWFGLLHTFAGNDCTGPGDYVSDTPAMINPPFYCDDTRDSCPQQKGIDPWNNYMNYVPDSCKEEFTQGQEDFMFASYSRFRGQGQGD